MNYILNDKGEPLPEKDIIKWGTWFQQAGNRKVASDQIGEFGISTVFLGIDHAFGEGPPILWETMVFTKGGDEVELERCSGSREQAEAMHARMVELIKSRAANRNPGSA